VGLGVAEEVYVRRGGDGGGVVERARGDVAEEARGALGPPVAGYAEGGQQGRAPAAVGVVDESLRVGANIRLSREGEAHHADEAGLEVRLRGEDVVGLGAEVVVAPGAEGRFHRGAVGDGQGVVEPVVGDGEGADAVGLHAQVGGGGGLGRCAEGEDLLAEEVEEGGVGEEQVAQGEVDGDVFGPAHGLLAEDVHRDGGGAAARAGPGGLILQAPGAQGVGAHPAAAVGVEPDAGMAREDRGLASRRGGHGERREGEGGAGEVAASGHRRRGSWHSGGAPGHGAIRGARWDRW
jgi:hypothetical protein